MKFYKKLLLRVALFASLLVLGGFAQATEIPLVKYGGVFTVPVQINGVITLHFVLDSGAAEVNIPLDVASTLVRAGTIRREDFLLGETYTLADGSKVKSPRFMIRELAIGGQKFENIPASIGEMSGSLLLGQSLLQRVESWALDNDRNILILGGVKKSVLKPAPPTGTNLPRSSPEGSKVAAVITSPRHGEEVPRSCFVTGSLSGELTNIRAFLVIQSTAAQFGQRVYPQGEIVPGQDGRWVLRGIYASPDFSYKTFVVVTENPGSVQLLQDQQSKMKGLVQLPVDTLIVSPVIVVNRK